MYALNLSERLGLEQRGGFLRLGLVHYNTHAEIDWLLTALDRRSWANWGRGGMGVVYQARPAHTSVASGGAENDPWPAPAGPARSGALSRRGRRHRPLAAPAHRANLRGRPTRRAAVFLPWSTVGGGIARSATARARRCRRWRPPRWWRSWPGRCTRRTTKAIVHRDLKPANVLLAESMARPRSPISAWPRSSTASRERPDRTTGRRVMGTPRYRAPRTGRRARKRPGPAADIYAPGGHAVRVA